MASNEETNAAGTDTRPPMLVESDYESWKIRIHRYIRGKPNGKLIWKSIQNGPTPHPMITNPQPTDSAVVPAPRKKLDSEFIRFPRHRSSQTSFKISTAKEIWDNVEMLMQGSGRTIQQRKEDLFDEYERFRAIGNESIHDYFLRTSSNLRTHATVHDGHIVTEPVQRKAPGNVGNTGARGKKVICYNCRGEGHVARQCKEPKRKMDSQYFKDKALLMEAKEKEMQLTTTNMFQANHEDELCSDFNEVTSNDNQIFDNVDYQLSQEMHQEEHLDFDAETEIDDNTIPYHQYLLDTEAQNVPTEVSADTSDKVSMIAILTDLQTQLDGHAKKELSQEQAYWLSANEIASNASNPATPVTPFVHNRPPPSQVLFHLQKVNAVFHQFEGIINERTTQKPLYVSEWCFDYAKQFVEQQLVPFYDHFKKHIESANETIFKEVKEYEQIFDDLDAEYERCVLDNKNLTIEKKNLLIKNDCLIAECLEKDICSIVLTSDIVVPPSSNCLCEDLRSACDREHTKVLELEAEVLKQQKMVIESEK
ncbi:integrase, catalytic region, zinc finger, CCHC-type containing protein, partial [Tanacetum coccineum]